MVQLLTRNALNIYSPKIVSQNGKMVMYCGGWMWEGDKPHDSIWRIQTNRRGIWGMFSKVLIPTPELYQVNDPVPVDMGEYWIMYLTENSSCDPENPTNSIYFCTSWDGIGWSRPTLLMNNYWLPSATKNGLVMHYTDNKYYFGVDDVIADNATIADASFTLIFEI